MFGYIHHFIGVEIESHYSVVGFWIFWFFFNTQNIPILVKVSNSITFGIGNPITEYGCFLLFLDCTDSLLQHAGKALAIEDIIT